MADAAVRHPEVTADEAVDGEAGQLRRRGREQHARLARDPGCPVRAGIAEEQPEEESAGAVDVKEPCAHASPTLPLRPSPRPPIIAYPPPPD